MQPIPRQPTGLAGRLLIALSTGAMAAAMTLLPVGVAAQGGPRRIVSLNLCGDELLLALADPGQIASLSPLARDPRLSFLADRAAAFPANGGRGEPILLSRSDLVLAGRYGSRVKRGLLTRNGLDVMVLDPWRSLDEGRRQIRAVAERIRQPARGEELVAELDAALARAKDIVPGAGTAEARTVLTLYRRGYVPAPDSLVNELLRHMGFALQQERLGLVRGGLARLETLVASPPDYVLMDDIAGAAIDNGSALLVHPALAAAIPPERRLVIPNRLTLCGGPSTPAAIDALAAEVRGKVR